jgi:nucleoside-diphosphate-sugar epimerase
MSVHIARQGPADAADAADAADDADAADAADDAAPPSGGPRLVVVFGAGGPVAAAAIRHLAARHRLRLTDLRPETIDAGAAGSGVDGAPPALLPVDVTEPDQVRRACAGADAVVNCSVARSDPVGAFRVNCVGAFHVMQGAVAHGVRRVVHTGPQLVGAGSPGEYWWDADVPDDAPRRPGTALYFLTKYLGLEVVRAFAETHRLSVPVLLLGRLIDPASPPAPPHPFSVSWQDAGRAVRCAVEVDSLPTPCEVFHIVADAPPARFGNAKARRLLGWQPEDDLASMWRKPS